MSVVIEIDDYDNVKVEKFGGHSIWTGFVRCAKCKKDVLPDKLDSTYLNPTCIYCGEKRMKTIERKLNG